MDLTGKTVAIRPDVLTRDLRGESVLLDLASERYFGLDEVGTGMWKALTSGRTVDAAIEALLEEYEVTREQLREDVTVFIRTLEDAGLVELRDA